MLTENPPRNIAAMDEMTADLNSEGTLEGLESARARVGGRPTSNAQHHPPELMA
ncbi:hypothetical protein ACWF9G_02780 [Nocardia sp. NPDC055029]